MIRADEYPEEMRVSARDVIPMEDYVGKNGIPFREAQILYDLHTWARGRMETLTDRETAGWIARRIDALSRETYRKDPQ